MRLSRFKRDPMEFDVTEKKRFKKNCYVFGKLGHLKRNCSKRTVETSEKWIEIIEEPETIIKINHENLSWTACSNDQCKIHRSLKENVIWYPKKRKILGKKPNISNKFYPTKTTSHSCNDDQNREIKNTSIDHTRYGKHDVDIIRKPNQKIFG